MGPKDIGTYMGLWDILVDALLVEHILLVRAFLCAEEDACCVAQPHIYRIYTVHTHTNTHTF
jgi:hypothetical protein